MPRLVWLAAPVGASALLVTLEGVFRPQPYNGVRWNDRDADGSPWRTDCDDTDAGVHPGATETCDGVDQDCDGHVDEDAADRVTSYVDGDGDGYGDPATASTACTVEPGWVVDGSDCDDADSAVFPDADDAPGDGVDSNCDGDTTCETLVEYSTATCFDSTCTLSIDTQADLVAFAASYNAVPGSLYVGYDNVDITDLSPLDTLCVVGSTLLLYDTLATEISGLDHLVSADMIRIEGNDALVSLSGFNGLEEVRTAITIRGHDQLLSIDGFNALRAVGPGATHYHSMYVNGNEVLEELHGFEALETIEGTLYFGDLSALVTVDAFPRLQEVGEIYMIDVRAMEDLDWLASLTTVESSIWLVDLASLASVEGLASLRAVPDIELDRLPSLGSLAGLEGLTSADSITLTELDGLTDVRALSSLTTLHHLEVDGLSVLTSLAALDATVMDGSVTIQDNAALTTLPLLAGTTELSSLDISDNPSLTSVDMLPDLTSIKSLGISDNDALTSVDGFDALTTLSVGLGISSNPSLATLTGFNGISVLDGTLAIEENTALSALDGFSALTEVTNGLSIEGNTAMTEMNGLAKLDAVAKGFVLRDNGLTDLTGLASLTKVTGDDLEITDNDSLTSLTGLEGFRRAGRRLVIDGNDALTDISALEDVTYVGDDLVIEDNTSLSTSDAEALVEAIGESNIAGSVSISGNAP